MRKLVLLGLVLLVLGGCASTTSDEQTDKAKALDNIVKQSADADKMDR